MARSTEHLVVVATKRHGCGNVIVAGLENSPGTGAVVAAGHQLADPPGRLGGVLAGGLVAWRVRQRSGVAEAIPEHGRERGESIGSLIRIGGRRHRVAGRGAAGEGE